VARTEGLIHSKLPPDARVNVRDTGAPIRTEDSDQFSPEFVASNLIKLREALGELARQTENHGNLVDEYNTCTITGAASESVLTVLPTYEYMPEKIISILVAGPPASSITLYLGDRVWPVLIPPAGIMTIGPVALILGRNDLRQLQSATPGNYFLELMGFADRRFAI
jgi:hypothetical protein